MVTRLLSSLAIWTFIVGCCFAFSGTSVPASHDVTAQAFHAVPDPRPVMPQTRSDPSVDRQMLALEHHARVNMILYTGNVGQSEFAARRRSLDAIALSLKAAGK